MTISNLNLATELGGKVSRDGESVVIGYGPLGYLRVTQDGTCVSSGVERPYLSISGKLTRRNGFHHAELRDRMRAAGYVGR